MTTATGCSHDLLATPSVSVVSQAPPLRQNGALPLGLRSFWKSSCYLNSVLQCLTFTPPLAEYCLRKGHSLTCSLRAGECTFCILESRIRMSLEPENEASIGLPCRLYKKMMSNEDYFRPGRYEDAHELLRFLIDECAKLGMHPGSPNDPKVVMESIFAGVLQNCIECKRCGAKSTRQEQMLDLNLDVSSERIGLDSTGPVTCFATSLAQSFALFFRPETLDGDNKYRCDSCASLSPARKRLSILQAPKVITIQLKRFCPLSGSKLHHHVKFEQRLCIAGYMSHKLTDPVPRYTLYGVIVHIGLCHVNGHYVAYVKERNGKWYKCDDEEVGEVSEERVLEVNAYLLFYIQD